MTSMTEQMLSSRWRGGGRRDVYADYNELTLWITMRALFGTDTTRGSQAQRIAGSEALDLMHEMTATAVTSPMWRLAHLFVNKKGMTKII
jgi:hypothetical protein